MKFYNHKYLLFTYLLLILVIPPSNLYSCTIFYLKGDSVNLAGNNEDWKDPEPFMWFYPPVNGKLGWVKFGWGSGFPQGGMNEKGLFWDATSGPSLAMPISEANKVKLSEPLMQKVIEECSSVEEALKLFGSYYCEDQYKAQYLVGDAENHAVIVEGDSILLMHEDHMILTNFYHSHPELGGYPCSRYETASELISASTSFTPELAGTILAYTHQEGKYPTQYAQVYDLKKQMYYLFNHFNFEEYIPIYLNEELKKGARVFSIPELFAGIELLVPDSGERLPGSSIEFSWRGKSGYLYELHYSKDPAFTESSTTTITHLEAAGRVHPDLILGATSLLLLLWIGRKRKQGIMVWGVCLILFPMQCTREEPTEQDKTVVISETAAGLESGITYYWKIKAHPVHSDDFWSETVISSFRTGD